MSLTRAEMETIIIFNEEDKTANVFTYNKKFIKKLKEAESNKPNECIVKNVGYDGSFTFSIPKKWVKINPGRVMTEEQKKILSERAKRLMHNNKNKSEDFEESSDE